MKMSPKKIERLIRSLRENGVEYLKTPEIEIRLRDMPAGAQVVPRLAGVVLPAVPVPNRPITGPDTGASIPAVGNEIPHHENEVAKLLKLSDSELVDRLFPDYTEGQAGTG